MKVDRNSIVALVILSGWTACLAGIIFGYPIISKFSAGVFLFVVILGLWKMLIARYFGIKRGLKRPFFGELLGVLGSLAFIIAANSIADRLGSTRFSLPIFAAYISGVYLLVTALHYVNTQAFGISRWFRRVFLVLGVILGAYAILDGICSLVYWAVQPPPTTTHAQVEVKLDLNEHGYRGTVFPYEKPPDVLRVLVLGDSFLEGYDVNFEQTFASLLQAQLNRHGIATEVIAIGSGGWGTVSEYEYYRDVGYRYHPDLVLYAFTEDDPEDNYPEIYHPELGLTYEVTPGQGVKSTKYDQRSFLRKTLDGAGANVRFHSNIFRLLDWWEVQRETAQAMTGPVRIARGIFSTSYGEDYSVAWKRTQDVLHIWAMAVKTNGSDFAILANTPAEILDSVQQQLYSSRFRGLASADFSPDYTLDSMPYLWSYVVGHHLSPTALQIEPNKNSHYSRLAHQLMANYLEDWLIAQYPPTAKFAALF